MKTIKEYQECIEKVKDKKIIPHSTQNILKDIEIDEDIFIEEICKGLRRESK
ncbi:MAG: hypothetical protein ACFFCE_16155 [Promethearchaeota archaeon]